MRNFKLLGAFVQLFAMFFVGMATVMKVFMWFPNDGLVMILATLIYAGTLATSFTYYTMLHPDWGKAQKELEEERDKFKKITNEILDIRKKYIKELDDKIIKKIEDESK